METYDNELMVLRQLMSQESVLRVLVATMIGLIPAFMFLSALTSGYPLPILLFVLPGVFVGYAVRFIANPIRIKLRLIPALSLFFVMSGYSLFYLVTPTFYGIAFANIFVVILISKRKLSKEEDRSLWLFENGKISL